MFVGNAIRWDQWNPGRARFGAAVPFVGHSDDCPTQPRF